jgi:hypothetical protein
MSAMTEADAAESDECELTHLGTKLSPPLPARAHTTEGGCSQGAVFGRNYLRNN